MGGRVLPNAYNCLYTGWVGLNNKVSQKCHFIPNSKVWINYNKFWLHLNNCLLKRILVKIGAHLLSLISNNRRVINAINQSVQITPAPFLRVISPTSSTSSWNILMICPFEILLYGLESKTSFLEQSEHFNFWCLSLPYYRLLAIVNALGFWPTFFWEDNLSNTIGICCGLFRFLSLGY